MKTSIRLPNTVGLSVSAESRAWSMKISTVAFCGEQVSPHSFAAAWRSQPKWVVSRTLKSVGPNATLVADDLEGAIRALKAGRDGEIEVAGPALAHSLTELGLIDEYRIYLHPVVLGRGTPYFAGSRPPLHLMASDQIDEDVLRLRYVPV